MNPLPHHRFRSDAFTLVELIAVIAVIGIVATIATVRLQPPRPMHAARMAVGMIEAARAEAIRAGARTRVAICVDSNSGNFYLRQLVGLLDSDADPATEEWTISSIRSLPAGTCFWTAYSRMSEKMNLKMQGPLATQTGVEGNLYVYIEFDSLGQCQSSSQWVFTQGIFDSTEPSIPQPLDRDGFIIRKTGQLAWFHSPEQILQVAASSSPANSTSTTGTITTAETTKITESSGIIEGSGAKLEIPSGLKPSEFPGL